MSDARRPNETDNDFLARLIFGETLRRETPEPSRWEKRRAAQRAAKAAAQQAESR